MKLTIFVIAIATIAVVLYTAKGGKVYTVGGNRGWILPPNCLFYNNWMSKHKIIAGDTLGDFSVTYIL